MQDTTRTKMSNKINVSFAKEPRSKCFRSFIVKVLDRYVNRNRNRKNERLSVYLVF